MPNPIAEAKRLLAELRMGTILIHAPQVVERIKQLLNQVGAKLEMIGASESELKRLTALNFVVDAEQQLALLRRDTHGRTARKSIVVRIKGDARNAGVSLSDIGTSEDELRDLVMR